ncbi:hypothetical protein KIPB_004120 [Kipferlia bialata]|uniref:ATP-dependent RNA helicase n=1 Tax=Kipferlia bialata TaxID=797122 RepID=A0A391NKE7_9EUKA|nr:hypothetical protein KIPB_004120 [Kipferlia bialata]|eukprot:g4120.t1
MATAGGSGTSILTDVTFESFGLVKNVLTALQENDFKFCTGIQAKAVPPLLKGQDVLGAAKTGSGKTLAFLLPAIQGMVARHIKHKDGANVLIISPTRELAIQTYDVAKLLMKNVEQTLGLVIGGGNRSNEAAKLTTGCNLVVATPGRLLDHIRNTKATHHQNQTKKM